jgi:hypothetical protein
MSSSEAEEETRNKKRRICNDHDDAEAGSSDKYLQHPPVSATVNLQVKSLLDPEAAEKTIDALLVLNLGEEENQAALDEFKFTSIYSNLVTFMDKNAFSATIQMKCCNILSMFTQNDVDGLLARAFLKAGAGKMILMAMKAYPRIKDMQYVGCMALRNLSYDTDLSDAKKMIEAGVIDVVLKAMNGSSSNSNINNVHRFSFVILDGLVCNYPVCSTELIEKKVVHYLLASMKRYIEDEKIQKYAVGFLADLVNHNPDASSLIQKMGGNLVQDCIECVLATTDKCLPRIEIQRKACRFLLLLAETNSDARDYIHKLGGVKVLSNIERFYRGKDEDIKIGARNLLRIVTSNNPLESVCYCSGTEEVDHSMTYGDSS